MLCEYKLVSELMAVVTSSASQQASSTEPNCATCKYRFGFSFFICM